MLEFMSCARPVILGVEGQAGKSSKTAGAGLVIEPENSTRSSKRSTSQEDRELGRARSKGKGIHREKFSRAKPPQVHRRAPGAYG